jgi:tetratricopeptide (TPR) repeat protein
LPARNRNDIPALAQAGVEFSHQQHFKEAADCYRKALAIDPKLRELQLNLGLAEFKLGDFHAAIGPLGATAALDPTNLQARTLLGMSYYGAGMFAKAVPELDRALAADSKNAQLHYVVAQSCLWSGKYARALQEFTWLLREQPDSAATHMLMGEALDGLGRETDAIAELQAAAAASPTQPELHFGLGYLYWKERRYEEAEREFRLELDKYPSHAQASAYLGDVLVHRDEARAAEPLLEKARRADPKIRIARLDLGILYAERKDNVRALRELRDAVRLDPSRADAHYRLSRVYLALGREAEAKAELAMVKQLHENRLEDALHRVSGKPPSLGAPESPAP